MMNLVDPAAVAHIPERRRAGRRWIAFITTLFLAQVAAVVLMIWIATSDRSFALEPDYYQKAMRWDDTSRMQRESDRLGWSVELRVDAHDDHGMRPITWRLVDEKQNPVDGAVFEAEWFHHARARERHTTAFENIGDGLYRAALRFERSGLYEFRIHATRGEQHFLRTVQHDIGGRDGAAP